MEQARFSLSEENVREIFLRPSPAEINFADSLTDIYDDDYVKAHEFLDDTLLIKMESNDLTPEQFEEIKRKYLPPKSNSELAQIIQFVPLRDIIQTQKSKPRSRNSMPPKTIKTNIRSRPRPSQSPRYQ